MCFNTALRKSTPLCLYGSWFRWSELSVAAKRLWSLAWAVPLLSQPLLQILLNTKMCFLFPGLPLYHWGTVCQLISLGLSVHRNSGSIPTEIAQGSSFSAYHHGPPSKRCRVRDKLINKNTLSFLTRSTKWKSGLCGQSNSKFSRFFWLGEGTWSEIACA